MTLSRWTTAFMWASLSCVSAEQQPTPEQQIAAALLPLPEAYRATATVVVYDVNDKLITLRKGSGDMVCEGDRPGNDSFTASCYHESAFRINARMRELRRELGLTTNGEDTVRKLTDAVNKEIREGKLSLPTRPSIGFRLAGPLKAFNWEKNEASREIERWEMIIVPNITGKDLSLPTQPSGITPWVMWEGTPLAHIMVQHRPTNAQ
jgi:hypothetical protein